MAELVFDVIEQIFVRLDVIDLIRCKSVCKSWLFLISTRLFVRSHLNYTCNKSYEYRNKRIVMHDACNSSINNSFYMPYHHIVGSSDGLVCISPIDIDLVVTNPLTREVRNLPTIPGFPKATNLRSKLSCWGFGYDSSTDDYKVIAGYGRGKYQTRFHVFTLKSNIWKLLGDINYNVIMKRPGILCEGSLHWFMNDRKKKKTIISFDMSRDEFRKIPQPYGISYECHKDDRLGFIEDSLCIYKHEAPRFVFSKKGRVKELKNNSKKWIMRTYNVRESWQRVPYRCERMIDVDPHYLKRLKYITHKSSSPFCRMTRNMDYFANPIFVPSLVSPHVNKTIMFNTKNDGKRKRSRHAKSSKKK